MELSGSARGTDCDKTEMNMRFGAEILNDNAHSVSLLTSRIALRLGALAFPFPHSIFFQYHICKTGPIVWNKVPEWLVVSGSAVITSSWGP